MSIQFNYVILDQNNLAIKTTAACTKSAINEKKKQKYYCRIAPEDVSRQYVER